jgi:uncharacterized membrane protein YgcG
MGCFSPLVSPRFSGRRRGRELTPYREQYDTLHQLVQVHSSGIPSPPDTPSHPFFARYAAWGIREPSFGAGPPSSSFVAPAPADLPPLPTLDSPPRVPSPTSFSFPFPTPTPAAFDFALDFSLGGNGGGLGSPSASSFNFGASGSGGGGGAVDSWFGATLPTSLSQVDDLTAEDFDVFAFLASPPGQLWSQT